MCCCRIMPTDMSQGKAPGGWVMKLSPTAKIEMLNMGYRNPCDFALNRDGELFIYDADMEWILVHHGTVPHDCHGVSGGESGWRATSKKWRKYFPDTVGSVVDIGPGCPTGVIVGTDAKFPTHYRDALFICDWTLPPCIPFISNPMVPHILAKKRISLQFRLDLLLSLMSILDRRQ